MSVITATLSSDSPLFTTVSHPTMPQRVATTKPLPTNSFWTNLIVGGGLNPIYINPYKTWFNGSGFNFNISDLSNSQGYIVSNSVVNFSINSRASTYSVIRWDLLSVDVSCGASVYSFFRGSPFVTVKCGGDILTFSTQHAVTAIVNSNKNKYTISLNNGQTWIIYHEGSLTINTQLQTNNYTGMLRLIMVPANGTQYLSQLDSYASMYPISGNVQYKVVNDTATMTYSWQTATMNTTYTTKALLMYAHTHHLTMFSSTQSLQLHTYKTIKGIMSAVAGSQWTMNLTLPTTTWKSNLTFDPQYTSILSSSLQNDLNTTPSASDPYFMGKQMARTARLILIADELGQTSNRDLLLTKLKNLITPWLLHTNSDQLVYDTIWRGIVSLNGVKDFNADFGNGQYNDHYFHYGYFIYCFAVICKYDSSFYTTYSNQIMAIVRDVANPSQNDPFFPVTRNKDWFDCHSWASGIVEFGDSKNQESTSESVNCYYSIYLLGLSLSNSVLTDLGRVLLATEILSCQTYWHIKDTSIYDNPFASNSTVGIVWSTKVDYATWFGANVEYIHCIQMLPFTPISENLLDSAWVKIQQPILDKSLTRNPPIADSWAGYLYMSKAIVDPQSALKWITSFNGGFDDGNTRTNTLYWILTRPGLGISRITSNPPSNPPQSTVLTIDSTSPVTQIIVKKNIDIQIQI